jgi:hypothetical protein
LVAVWPKASSFARTPRGSAYWTTCAPDALVLDMSQLAYFGGDTLLAWESIFLLLSFDEEKIRVSFICNNENIEHVRSLIAEVADEERTQAFVSEEHAFEFAFWQK